MHRDANGLFWQHFTTFVERTLDYKISNLSLIAWKWPSLLTGALCMPAQYIAIFLIRPFSLRKVVDAIVVILFLLTKCQLQQAAQ